MSQGEETSTANVEDSILVNGENIYTFRNRHIHFWVNYPFEGKVHLNKKAVIMWTPSCQFKPV